MERYHHSTIPACVKVLQFLSVVIHWGNEVGGQVGVGWGVEGGGEYIEITVPQRPSQLWDRWDERRCCRPLNTYLMTATAELQFSHSFITFFYLSPPPPKDTIWTNTQWHFEPLLWSWPCTQQSIFFTRYPSLWWSTINRSSVATGWAVHKLR